MHNMFWNKYLITLASQQSHPIIPSIIFYLQSRRILLKTHEKSGRFPLSSVVEDLAACPVFLWGKNSWTQKKKKICLKGSMNYKEKGAKILEKQKLRSVGMTFCAALILKWREEEAENPSRKPRKEQWVSRIFSGLTGLGRQGWEIVTTTMPSKPRFQKKWKRLEAGPNSTLLFTWRYLVISMWPMSVIRQVEGSGKRLRNWVEP